MFNKHWSPDVEVTILGYNPPLFNLPPNFKFVSLGKQEEYGNEWTTALIPYFKQMPDEYFILFLDDIYILSINKSLLHTAEKYMIDGVEKVHLINFDGQVFKEEKDVNFNTWEQGAKYRLALQPAFIRRDHFLKYLIPGIKTIWKYDGNYEIAKNDGAQILVPKQNIISYANFILRGKLRPGEMSKIKKEDLDAIKQLGVF